MSTSDLDPPLQTQVDDYLAGKVVFNDETTGVTSVDTIRATFQYLKTTIDDLQARVAKLEGTTAPMEQ